MIDHAEADEARQLETVTPFVERALTELTMLLAQLITTPFAFMLYSRQFRDQIDALAKGDLNTAYPPTVARPLSFYVMWFGAHFLLSNVYWRMVLLDKRDISVEFSARLDQINKAVKQFSDITGGAGAIIILALAVTLIIAVNAYAVTILGYVFRCPVRFRSVLHSSAYAFGTIIFFQYAFISMQYVGTVAVGPEGMLLGHDLFVYGSLAVTAVSVVRINQIIHRLDGTPLLLTYLTWVSGTFLWQFGILFVWLAVLGQISVAEFGGSFFVMWQTFFGALKPMI